MRVNSWEEGNRPALWTRARQQAPAARAAFTQMLSTQDWASMAYVIIDWTGLIAFVDNHGRSHDMAPADRPALDRAAPVMYLQVIKSMPRLGGTAIVEERLDIDDVFGGTTITQDDLAHIVLSLKEELDALVEQKVKEDR